MPDSSSDTEVLAYVVVRIEKEAGPVIYSQSHPTAIGSLIFPSESLNDDPSNEIQSAGRVVTWSGPAIAIGVLLFSDHPSQDVSFLLGKKVNPYIKSSSYS